ncbi:chymotrypsin-like elastase family member 1 [Platichthys flesus]|uniref:chymotrypsin-like elastase family member 1 n=1 Tax=Platichthys flesus TaxID=8260 RepID=UPI002DBA900E|nr:chymotrypsin-like elastase family member 1 [Platichthys flesus]
MIWCVLLLSGLGLICAEEPFNRNGDNERVIGGGDAEHGIWKWQASIQHGSNDWYGHICGGTIVSGSIVMTAAHCIISMDPSQYRVVTGEYNMLRDDGSEQYSPVAQIYVHPYWNGQLGNGNDIALLRLAVPVYHNGYVAIAELPSPHQMLPHGFTCYITGWGYYDNMGSNPTLLQVAPINIVEHSVCSQPNWWGSLALKSMVCAGGDGVISGCQGDSGGPLSCYIDGAWRVHGVVSYGPMGWCNQVTKPTVFTRVSSFIDWINSVRL